MANVYWGDGGVTAVDGNWNHAVNWFSAPTPDGTTAGTALGRVPQAGDSVVLTDGPAASNATVTTGPTGGWAGPLSIYAGTNAGASDAPPGIATGTYSGVVTLSPGNVGSAVSGGTFSSAVALNNSPSAAPANVASLTGGNFTGTLTRTNPNTDATGLKGHTAISGGTYSPSASCALGVSNVLSDANLPVDPGFAVGGGTFSPVITVTGITAAAAGVSPAMNVSTGGAGNISAGRYSPPFPQP